MNPYRATLQLLAGVANNAAASQTPVSGTALTLNGAAASAGVATFDVARRVLLTYGNEGAPRTLAITGTDRWGNAQSETLAVPSGASGTVYTQRDFKTVRRALPAGGGWTAAVTLGTNGIGSTGWVTREWGQLGTLGVTMTIGAGLTVNASFEITWDDPEAALDTYPYGVSVEPASNVPPIPQIPPGWGGLTATTNGEIHIPFFAWRMTINSGVDPVTLQVIETTSDRKDAF